MLHKGINNQMVYFKRLVDGNVGWMHFSDEHTLYIDEGDPDFGRIEESNYTTYVKRQDADSWWIHRAGGKPAIIARGRRVAFFEDGVPKRIEDLGIDEMDRLVMVLKSDLQLSNKVNDMYYVYDGELDGE